MKSFLGRFALAAAVFLFLSYGMVYIAVIANQFFISHELHVVGFWDCVELIKTNQKCLQWYIVLELLSFALSALILLFRSDYYSAKQIRITDKISIPAPAGQGQHGTARFATKAEIKKNYPPIYIKKNDETIQRLLDEAVKRKEKINAYAAKEAKEAKEKIRADKSLKKQSKKRSKIKAILIRPIKAVKRFFSNITKSISHWWKDQIILGVCAVLIDIHDRFKLWRKDRKDFKFAVQPSRVEGLEENEQRLKHSKEKNVVGQTGIVLNASKGGTVINTIARDKHVLVIGSTDVGKTRRLVIPTVCGLALGGESMVITDPKGEITAFTSEFLKSLGYKVVVMDFFDMACSSSINPLQPIIDAVNAGDVPLATTRTWDLANMLVAKSDRSEPIWTNGELSVIAASILCVVFDNKDNPQYQNLTNVYWFLAEMCKTITIGNRNVQKIKEYVKGLPDTHPAKPLLGIADIAPDKTAGSFYTSALTTLRLFTSGDIFNITNSSDLDFADLGKQKVALFFVLPDSKTTYYPIVSLLCSQIYDVLTETAKRSGNRLDRRVNFILDEFGNFTKITDFAQMLTVGRGYGIRYALFVQSFAQLEEKYDKTGEKTIKDNCIWIYLGTSGNETNKEVEERLGKYTTTSYSLGSSNQRRAQPSNSSNVNLAGRELLNTAEIARIGKPYLLVMEAQQNPAVTILPDLSEWYYNTLLGLGDQKFNKNLIKYFNAQRKRHVQKDVELWGIWNYFSGGSVVSADVEELPIVPPNAQTTKKTPSWRKNVHETQKT